MENTLNRLLDFFDIEDENGVSNLVKVHKYQKILRRVETTDKSMSVEAIEGSGAEGDVPNGINIAITQSNCFDPPLSCRRTFWTRSGGEV